MVPIRGTATVAGGDVAAREDAQKVKEERDAAARRAEMEAALDEEAVEPPTIPEDAPAGTQGRLFDDAPPVVETTTEEAVEEGAPPCRR